MNVWLLCWWRCWPAWHRPCHRPAAHLYGHPAILAGILTQLALYSINLKIMGKANQSINVDKYGLLISLRWVKRFALHNPIIMVICHGGGHRRAVLVLRYRAGLRHPRHRFQPRHVPAQGINTNFNIVLGLAVSNAWWPCPVRC